jgi:CMP/dCMP kinase
MAKKIITIDGPAASGKSTVAKNTAKKIGAVFLDTGAMYRAVTLAAIRNNCDLSDKEALVKILAETRFQFETIAEKMRVFINGIDVTDDIRDPEVTAKVHYIASVPELRGKLVEMQRQFAVEHKKIVTEGRDQGTVVFPDAQAKFFLTASPCQRAERRAKELGAKGLSADVEQIRCQIEKRDEADSSRAVGPLLRADDAVEIDTTNLTVDEVVTKLMRYIEV